MDDNFLEIAREFFESNRQSIGNLSNIGKESINLSFNDLSEYSPQLSDGLIDRPEETIQLMEKVFNELEWTPKKTHIRFMSISPTQELFIRNVRAKHLGKMICIEGIVRQASEVRPLVTNAKFECPSCGTIISVLQIDKKFKEPSRCSCGRRGGFKEISKDMVDAQVLKIEEASDNLSGGEQPKRMTIFLKEDLVEPNMEIRTTPGSRVKIIGVLKEVKISVPGGSVSTRFDLAIEANNIIPLDESFEDIDIDVDEKEEIKLLSKNKEILDLITRSIAPSIQGNLELKKIIALQLFGGVRTMKKDGTFRRGSIHVLTVSDPGLGKSVMLNFAHKMLSRSRFVSGKSTTTAGLIAGVTKDEMTHYWSLEAGAMVLANDSIIMVDEFEKMSEEDRSSMHQAMEQQEVNISKVSIQAKLSTRTAVLAAANPKHGRFKDEIPLDKQINLSPSLLSRFDVVYVMRDLPEEKNDSDIADKILDISSDGVNEDFIEQGLLKKYISYARNNFSPEMTEKPAELIKQYYIKMRKPKNNLDNSAIAIGTRQLEGMVRLAQAHAKMRLSNYVEEIDALKSIETMNNYLVRMGFDEGAGEFDIDKIVGISNSKRSRISLVYNTLINGVRSSGHSLSYNEVNVLLPDFSEDEIYQIISQLKYSGEIFEPSPGHFRTI